MTGIKPTDLAPVTIPTAHGQGNSGRVCQKGLVGWFDILGYHSFLKRNPEDAAKQVLDKLNQLADETPQMYLGHMGWGQNEQVLNDINKIGWLVFADTVILTSDIAESDTPHDKNVRWGWFLLHSIYLWRIMFDYGLPIRGAITKGSYLIQRQCFAGEPILNAECLSSNLNCAGVVIADDVVTWANEECCWNKNNNPFYFDYPLPFKASNCVAKTVLNVAWSLADPRDPKLQKSRESWAGDIRQLVHESFWGHKKSIGPGVIEKLENTERMLRFLKLNRPDMFHNPTEAG